MSEKLLINEDMSNNFEVKSNNLPSVLTNEEKVSVKVKQIEEMAYEMTQYKGKMCERIVHNNCLLRFHAHAFIDCDYCKLAEHLITEKNYRKQEWISVEDRLPEDYNKYLLLLDNGRIAIGWYHGDAMQFVEDGIVMIETVTHWMPLPEAPKMKGGEE